MQVSSATIHAAPLPPIAGRRPSMSDATSRPREPATSLLARRASAKAAVSGAINRLSSSAPAGMFTVTAFTVTSRTTAQPKPRSRESARRPLPPSSRQQPPAPPPPRPKPPAEAPAAPPRTKPPAEAPAAPSGASRLEIEVTAAEGLAAVPIAFELTQGGSASAPLPAEVSAAEGGGVARGSFAHGGPLHGMLRVGSACVAVAVVDPARGGKPSKEAAARNHVVGHYGLDKDGAPLPDGVERQRVIVVDRKLKLAAEVRIAPGAHATAQVAVRAAKEAELRKAEATEDLLEAETGTKFSWLHACIVKARARGAEAVLLDRASGKLKTLQVSAPDLGKMTKALRWQLVTTPADAADAAKCVCEREGCAVDAPLDGEVMELVGDGVGAALGMLLPAQMAPSDGTPWDQWLFAKLTAASLRAQADGGVWRSGKHVIFSAPTRNQSPVAFRNYLARLGEHECAAAFDALVQFTELKYSKQVTACQVNLHLDSSSCHKQHRDIYGLDQRERAGRDCTCSFKENVATACFSLGSSRRIMIQAETDKLSYRKKCCAECGGSCSKPWINSGELMYFNDRWNRSWNHGIPPHDEGADGKCGPRISIALLCAEGTEACALPRKAKQTYDAIKEVQLETVLTEKRVE